MDRDWNPSSWRSKPITQSPEYADSAALAASTAQLRRLPPLATPTEIAKLKASLRDVALGKAFLLQGGDCAELFSYCEDGSIDAKVKLLLQMSLVLVWGARKPVVRIARMAGQYAKPRSSPMETVEVDDDESDCGDSNGEGRVNGDTGAAVRGSGNVSGNDRNTIKPSKRTITIPSFRGDILNSYNPTLSDRTLDPSRLVAAYFHSAATLNYLRAQLASGFADLHNPLDWNLGHVRDAQLQSRYAQIVSSITESLRFMHTVGADEEGWEGRIRTVDMYVSHEGLLLEYEEAMTRYLGRPRKDGKKTTATSTYSIRDNDQSHTNTASNTLTPHVDSTHAWYDTSGHFLWIGDRTRQLDSAHVEFFRGLENPIGIKVGPSMQAAELVDLLEIVNPHREVGKVTLITRYGADRIAGLLGAHIDAVRASGHVVVWQCDPMHGNTISTPTTGLKTRSFTAITAEVAAALAIHRAHHSFLSGLHLELTGDAVTECVGGSEDLDEADLQRNYTTHCDPRLNEKQALELAFLVAGFFRGEEEKEGVKS